MAPGNAAGVGVDSGSYRTERFSLGCSDARVGASSLLPLDSLQAGRGGGAAVEVPFSVKDVYGTGGQVKVCVTFDGRCVSRFDCTYGRVPLQVGGA